MNKELFDSMQEQMKPTTEVRAALSEKLAQPVKRRMSVRKYAAVAACAALVLALCGAAVVSEWDTFVARYMREHPNATYYESSNGGGIIVESFRPDNEEHHLHSYILIEDSSVYHVTEQGRTQWFVEWLAPGNAVDTGTGTALSVPNTGSLPSGAYVGDIPVQEGAEDYQRLMAHFNGTYPDWYGGSYLDNSGWLVVQLVKDKDPGDKSLELQVQDWADSGHVMFASCKYSLAHLNELMEQLNQLPDTDLKCRDIMAGWGIDEKDNRIELTLTDVNDHILNVLFHMDPEEDAIYVQVGQPPTFDVDHDIQPGGTTVQIVPEDDKDLTAIETYYDGAHYDVEHLPEELPEKKQPAVTVQSASEDASAASYNPNS